MSDPLFEQDDAATPLSEEEKEGLIPSYITLRGELNEAEQANILEAEEWAFKRKRDVLDERFLNDLHKRMYGRVWRWAGQYRRTGKNIGVDAYRISMELRQLIEDCRFWIENETYPPDEIAARFHHKLVWIHAYPNGNGRHARLATDLLLTALGRERFTWGRVNLVDASETRQAYVAALRAADAHDYAPLFEFVRS
ncbi:MAG: mobile mystery protein B [Candidatus Thiodiazotropha endolucinida]|nr:mobile mystery protein B [Candidatus Thiodiazotropha taylori]MCG8092699.1 mobile mystery protein B [Candidatus Thiodiazotropha endolucinida]MCG8053123.1 mobile mystery protein B [Candidatus Thiodiazotropha taylori]MCG8072790.1 mobile mystery protein B [Candidatus Thiodiazotropha taylori]MCW4314942.1 mobile mystery protein B [Candidatus Thiodiazotropha taylori]